MPRQFIENRNQFTKCLIKITKKMKKLFLTLVIAFAGIFTANAQVWLGGSFNTAIGKNTTAIEIAPEVGYSLSNVPLTFAAAVDFAYAEVDGVGHGWALALTPYVRYTVATVEKFSVALDALGQFGVKNVDGYKVGVRPIVAWMATKHWTAAFSVGFLGYDKMNYDQGAFVLDFETAAPRFGLYYNF